MRKPARQRSHAREAQAPSYVVVLHSRFGSLSYLQYVGIEPTKASRHAVSIWNIPTTGDNARLLDHQIHSPDLGACSHRCPKPNFTIVNHSGIAS